MKDDMEIRGAYRSALSYHTDARIAQGEHAGQGDVAQRARAALAFWPNERAVGAEEPVHPRASRAPPREE